MGSSLGGRPLVLVVDDEPKILDIVKSYLENSGYRVLTAEKGTEALSLLRLSPVSLVLLDLMLPGMSGEEICRKIRGESDVPIIMMTAKIGEDDIIRGLSLGADDYVTKPFSPRQLMARVAAVLRRSANNSGTNTGKRIYETGSLTVDTENRRAYKNGNLLTLTPNEYKIIALLISRPQKIFTRDEIIEAIKNDDYDGIDRNIDVHISNLRQKIEDESKHPRLIITVYGVGYRFGGEA